MPQPTLKPVRDQIATQYPASAYASVQDRLNAVIRDASFTCNNWQLFQAYHNGTPTYMMEYDYEISLGKTVYLPALHGTDLAPTFWNDETVFWKFLQNVAGALNRTIPDPEAKFLAWTYGIFASSYQSFLLSNAIYGDPNNGSFRRRHWSTASTTVIAGSTYVNNVQRAQFTFPQYAAIADTKINVTACSFWQSVAATIDPVSATQTPPPSMLKQGSRDGHAVDFDELK